MTFFRFATFSRCSSSRRSWAGSSARRPGARGSATSSRTDGRCRSFAGDGIGVCQYSQFLNVLSVIGFSKVSSGFRRLLWLMMWIHIKSCVVFSFFHFFPVACCPEALQEAFGKAAGITRVSRTPQPSPMPRWFCWSHCPCSSSPEASKKLRALRHFKKAAKCLFNLIYLRVKTSFPALVGSLKRQICCDLFVVRVVALWFSELDCDFSYCFLSARWITKQVTDVLGFGMILSFRFAAGVGKGDSLEDSHVAAHIFKGQVRRTVFWPKAAYKGRIVGWKLGFLAMLFPRMEHVPIIQIVTTDVLLQVSAVSPHFFLWMIATLFKAVFWSLRSKVHTSAW